MRLGLIDGGQEYSDSISSLALPEVYYAGEDNDTINGGNGNDRLTGLAGDDVLTWRWSRQGG